MLVSIKTASHGDFHRGSDGAGLLTSRICSRYGERGAAYYTLAWFDRYLKGATDAAVASEALSRLTADRFGSSADVSSIGMGVFDRERAKKSGDVECGNRPIRIEGKTVADAISYYRTSGYYFGPDGPSCEDLRSGLGDGSCLPTDDHP